MNLMQRKFFTALLIALTALVGASGPLWSETLTTNPPNNGSGGVFLDLTSLGQPLSVESFAAPFGGTAGANAQVEVWTRPGSYVGFDGSSAGWTLHDTASAVTGGSTVFAPFTLTTAIDIGAGATVGVYLHSITSGQGLRYTGTGTGGHQTTFSDANMSLFSDVARTGNVSFGGTRFSPRTFSGSVTYSVVPEPASILLLGMFGVFATMRRR